MKILFAAPRPVPETAVDGYMQRIVAIDELFANWQRIYLEDANGDVNSIADSFASADIIYVHSIYQARDFLTQFPYIAERTVLDIHGAVPEELALSSKRKLAARYSRIERRLFSCCKNYVAVSRSMIGYYQRKYPSAAQSGWIHLPIFGNAFPPPSDTDKIPRRVVYAGGTQEWQNVDRMIDAINRSTPNITFDILTNDTAAFDQIKNNGCASIRTVPSTEVATYYARASLGFLLRDDHAVNRVACPTKLIEYLSAGVVPIVLTTNIGDFGQIGFHSIPLEHFLEGNFDEQTLESARKHNYQIVAELAEQSASGGVDLVTRCREIVSRNAGARLEPMRLLKNVDRQIRADKLTQLGERIPRIKGKLLRMIRRQDRPQSKDES